ncbi:MAG: hypothetical protein LBI01_05600 [Elusimicrobium sp.]|jgi:hypothetical protein|nr:hypothetical protein [Elusimicrobium sp.]
MNKKKIWIIIVLFICIVLAAAMIYQFRFPAATESIIPPRPEYSGGVEQNIHRPILPEGYEEAYAFEEESLPVNDLIDVLKQALYLDNKGKWAVRESGFLKGAWNENNRFYTMLEKIAIYETAAGFDSCAKASDCTSARGIGYCMSNLPVSKKDIDKYNALLDYASMKLYEMNGGWHIDPPFLPGICISEPVFACLEGKCALSKKGEGRSLSDEEIDKLLRQ